MFLLNIVDAALEPQSQPMFGALLWEYSVRAGLWNASAVFRDTKYSLAKPKEISSKILNLLIIPFFICEILANSVM